jgi:hypothetical protein
MRDVEQFKGFEQFKGSHHTKDSFIGNKVEPIQQDNVEKKKREYQ